tara:strand:+ start:317 stop:964 length:648 start_codon:yes stop_codon:yes gene_type:complete
MGTIKPIRKVIGSITGEEWETRAGGIPRRKLPDGRTETGRIIIEKEEIKIEEDETELEISLGPDDIIIEGEENLEWKPATMSSGWASPDGQGGIEVGDVPKIEPTREKQAPASTKKDVNKLQDLFVALGCVMDNETYSGEDKALIISRLFSDTTDVRIETAQTVISARTYGIVAAVVAGMVLLKGSGPLFQNYGKMFQASRTQDLSESDPFGENG